MKRTSRVTAALVVLALVLLSSCVPGQDVAARVVPHAPAVAEGEPVFAMRVGRSLEVAVRVTDAEGLPVAGTRVHWSSTVAGFPTEVAPDPETSRTDADGIATTTFESSQVISLVVTAAVNERVRTVFPVAFVDGTPVAIFPDANPIEGTRVFFTADAGSALAVAVRVVDAADIPVEGVQVRWGSGGEVWQRSDTPSPDPSVSGTDAEGRARTTFTAAYGTYFTVTATVNDHVRSSFGVEFRTGPAVAFSDVAECTGGAPGDGPLHPINFRTLDAAGLPTRGFVTLTVLDGGGYLSKPGTTELRVETSPNGWLLEGWGLVNRPNMSSYYRFGEQYWVLGPTLGVQRAKATLPNGEERFFTAEARAPYIAFREPGPTLDSYGYIRVLVDVCQADSSEPRTLTIGGVAHPLTYYAAAWLRYAPDDPCLFVGSASGADLTFPVTVTVSAQDTGGVSASVSAEVTR